MQTDIILTTLNARYTHASLALRYLIANLNELQDRTKILEFVINENNQILAEKILKYNPKIVGISLYIWNATDSKELIDIIKKISPETIIVLGGPEVSHFPMRVDFKYDYIIQGEGEVAFYNLCNDILNKKEIEEKIIKTQMVDLSSIKTPYEFYDENDIKHRYTYVEASRGCPFLCEFCLSSLDKQVRTYEIDRVIDDFQKLWDRGVRNYKFIDRTFNLNIVYANRLIDFFLEKDEEYSVHFEVIPDNFPESLKEKIVKFPKHSLQFEIGIQTLDKDIAKNIKRNLNIPKIEENIKFLEDNTNAHIHLDLIVGLPGESLEGFAKNLDKLYQLSRCEIQIGILKKLSGTTLNRHDIEYAMVYSDKPPYDLLQNNQLSFKTMQEMKRFARYWDIVYNSGNFKNSSKLLFESGKVFDIFYKFTLWIYDKTESTWKISFDRMAQMLFEFMIENGFEKEHIAKELISDITKVNRRKIPSFLREFVDENELKNEKNLITRHNKRQLKHG